MRVEPCLWFIADGGKNMPSNTGRHFEIVPYIREKSNLFTSHISWSLLMTKHPILRLNRFSHEDKLRFLWCYFKARHQFQSSASPDRSDRLVILLAVCAGTPEEDLVFGGLLVLLVHAVTSIAVHIAVYLHRRLWVHTRTGWLWRNRKNMRAWEQVLKLPARDFTALQFL